MRQLSKIFILIVVYLSIPPLFTYGAIKSGINYSIPIDYSKLSEQELSETAKKYFINSLPTPDNIINENITNALFLYSVLSNKNPDIIEYPIKIGILNDKLGRDRYAKGNFSKAIGINPQDPISYYYYGEFYYKREMYRKALKYYNIAYKLGYDKNYDLLYRIGDIYEKFGDSISALKYLQNAYQQNPNLELENKIKRIEAFDKINKEYYSNTRIRK